MGKVALVTGGNRGIGRGMATGLAKHGAAVVICGRTASELDATTEAIRSFGGTCSSVIVDVTYEADLRQALATCVERHGGIDILVANAGSVVGKGFPGQPDNSSDQEIDLSQTMALNFTSVYRLCQLSYPLFLDRGGGKIITVGSTYSYNGAHTTAGLNYSVSKHAILGLTRSLATAWANDNIQVNCLIPGWITTKLTEQRRQSENTLRPIEDRIPDPRGMGHEDDCATTAVFLASPHSSYITGTTIVVDGGYGVTLAPRRPKL